MYRNYHHSRGRAELEMTMRMTSQETLAEVGRKAIAATEAAARVDEEAERCTVFYRCSNEDEI